MAKRRAVAQWNALKPATRRRYERTVGRASYLRGDNLAAARGHSKTPERPSRIRTQANKDRYPEYARKQLLATRLYRLAAEQITMKLVLDGADYVDILIVEANLELANKTSPGTYTQMIEATGSQYRLYASQKLTLFFYH